ncbi:MAG: NAD-dependent epimerase/dehydratase family protein [Nonlabens sp.]
MIRIGITGQNGFIGSHLYNTLKLSPDLYELVDFEKEYFSQTQSMSDFVDKCDVIFHLAAMNRHDDPQVIYETNVDLVKKLVKFLNKKTEKTQVIFSSSAQENKDNLYGKSKAAGAEIFEKWAANSSNSFTSLVIPNVYGAFGKPFYNSFIATFCHLLTHGGNPEVQVDNNVPLIYVHNLVHQMIDVIDTQSSSSNKKVIKEDGLHKVSEILSILKCFQEDYFEKGTMPALSDDFELNLFNTYRSYIDHEEHFPVNYVSHSDDRGSFTEIIRLEQFGQVSFSTTHGGITRGNHYHTRKIERFSVIKGTALIEMRRIGTEEVLSFEIDGSNPGYVDMPIWYTHNIKNIGKEDLYTIFWINEFYVPEDPDTYFETV